MRTKWADIVPISLTRKPLWKRQPSETRLAYSGFEIYRDMPLPRARERVAKKMNRYTGTVDDWSKKYAWGPRIDAWDEHLEERKIAAQEKAVEEMNELKVISSSTVR